MTISARAVLQCLESERFARTRRHFTKKVRFVITLVITGRIPWPGIAKKSLIWPQSDATFFGVSEMNLARGGSWGSWCHRGDMRFFTFFQKWVFRAHETSAFEDRNLTKNPDTEK